MNICLRANVISVSQSWRDDEYVSAGADMSPLSSCWNTSELHAQWSKIFTNDECWSFYWLGVVFL